MAFVSLLHHFAAPPDPSADPEPQPRRFSTAPPVLDLVAEKQAAFEAGRQAALAEVAPTLADLEDRLAAAPILVDPIERARKAALLRASDDVATLVIELARRVLGDSLSLHPDALPGLVRTALARLPDEDEVWIKVPAGSVDRVSAVVPERHRSRVVADPTLTTGCVVETRHVAIDGSIEAAMQGITEATEAWKAMNPAIRPTSSVQG